MSLKQYLVDLTRPLHENVYQDLLDVQTSYEKSIATNSELINQLSIVRGNLHECIQKKEEKKSAIDLYLSAKYQVMPNKAYTNKRGKRSQTLWLNQMITPQAWEVQQFAKRRVKETDNLWVQASTLGEALAKHTTWVDEQKLYDGGDYYLYPEETLTTSRDKADCEDMSYTFASFLPQHVGVCYGMYHNKEQKQSFGHAYPVLLYSSKLYIVETTGNSVEIVPFDDLRYETYFIVTKDYTYQVKGGLEFGQLAAWE